ncbi:AAA family ATPase [Hoeflea sp. YIM 152468]|uniref:ATP-binding protein n=1 Tax=Hoeflea sp. YIM 152468 TaxID=3031759 RepID=UPI0023DCE5B1|nr:AAA family ATPase [Hoeflea sp. YIM 152468]MDF1609423.1 AAA family ATPase [Hoeflea sp. YIM 152468]
MRLNRLDLTRYGKFTDHVIDFGSAPKDGADLHIVYGPNEAGKSTLFNAWLDLLFGIGVQSSYNFLHPYPTMRIGAAIDIGGEVREFARIKRTQNSLLDGRDQPISEAALLAGLGGLDRDSYKTMFSLDDETLEQGGESILASRGDLGELLFSASAGLGELSQRLAGIRSEAEEFYKYRARSGRLADLKSELAALKAERDRIDTLASDYARLTRALDEASASHAATSAERRTVTARLGAINRLFAARPRLAECDRLQDQLAACLDVPDVAPEWRAQIARLRDDDAALQARDSALSAEIERLTAEQQTIPIDDAILALRGHLAELDRLRTRHDAAREDLPERRAALTRIDGGIEQLLLRLGRPGEPDASRLLLTTARTATLRDLVDARASLDIRLAAAKKEAADAQASRDEAQARLGTAGGGGEALPDQRQDQIAALNETLASLRNDDHGVRRQAALRALVPAGEKADQLLSTLAPWTGDADQLQALRIPSPEVIQKLKNRTEDIARNQAGVAEEVGRSSRAIKRHQAEADAVAHSQALVSAADAAALRTSRDQAWHKHRARLDAETATDFEAAMQAYDAAADTRAAHQAEAAKLGEITVQIAIARAELEDATARKLDIETARTGLQAEISGVLSALSPDLPADMTPDALEGWLHRRDMALEAARELRRLQRDLEIADEDRQTARTRLLAALAPLDPDTPDNADLADLLSRAQTLVTRETRLEAHRQALNEQRRLLRRRELDLRSAEAESQAWLLAWKQACSGCWLGDGPHAPTAAELREALPLLGDLATALHDRAGLADRVAKMERDQADYLAALRATAIDAGLEAGDPLPAGLARQLAERLAAAEQARTRHDELARQIEEAQARQRQHVEDSDVHAGKKAQMLEAVGAETLTEAALHVEQALERKQLAARIEAIGIEIREALGVGSLAAARAEIEAADADQLGTEKQALETSLETLDLEIQQQFAAKTRAVDALNAVGGDDAVARIEQQRRTVLLAIADGAERYLRLSAGIIAMEQALTLYRERHRSSMMARASDAVRTISRGRYTGLASMPDKGRELLIATQNDGSSKQAAEMSKGARFQLYLALRVAGFHEFAETRQTVPFIADDIMETFDDFRAEETFRLFSGMAGTGQVIYLTHHRHLCDIAQSVCPEVTIHQLTA